MDTALLIEKLNNTHSLNKDEALQLIKQGAQHKNLLFALAQQTAQKSFGRQIFVRADRIYQLLQKRLLLLRHKAQQQKCRALPPYAGRNSGMLPSRVLAWLPHLCFTGRRGLFLQRRGYRRHCARH
mgnify:CR=1 FL=1